MPDRVVVCADDDMLIPAAGDVGDHVAFHSPRQEAAADPDAYAHPIAQPLGAGSRDERGRGCGDVGVSRHERDRPERERARQEARDLPACRIDDCEVREPSVADRGAAPPDPAHHALAVECVRVHARPGLPALALDLEQRLVRLVREQLELLEPHREAELPESFGHGVRRARGVGAPGSSRPDLACQCLHEVHQDQPS